MIFVPLEDNQIPLDLVTEIEADRNSPTPERVALYGTDPAAFARSVPPQWERFDGSALGFPNHVMVGFALHEKDELGGILDAMLGIWAPFRFLNLSFLATDSEVVETILKPKRCLRCGTRYFDGTKHCPRTYTCGGFRTVPLIEYVVVEKYDDHEGQLVAHNAATKDDPIYLELAKAVR